MHICQLAVAVFFLYFVQSAHWFISAGLGFSYVLFVEYFKMFFWTLVVFPCARSMFLVVNTFLIEPLIAFIWSLPTLKVVWRC